MRLLRLFPAALAGLLLLSTGRAATITVDTTAHQWNTGGACSIREALDRVRAGSNGRGCTATGAYGTNDTIILAAVTVVSVQGRIATAVARLQRPSPILPSRQMPEVTAQSGPISVSASILNGSCTTNGGSIDDSATTSTPIELYTAMMLNFATKEYILEGNYVLDHTFRS